MGTHILLGTYTFSVLHPFNFEGGLVSNVIELTAVTMTDTSAIDLLANLPSNIVDIIGTSQFGNLEIALRNPVNSFLELTKCNIFNTNVLNGGTTTFDFPA